MQDIVLERHADVDLHFTGELIANVDSLEPGKDRWEEIRIWKTDGSTQTQWVVENKALSDDPRHRPIIRTFKCKTPFDVRNALRKKDPTDNPPRYFLTNLAFDALEQAADADDRIKAALIERV